MSDYKERFYRSYYSTHVLPRKGEATLARFRSRARAYRGIWGRLLPADRQSHILDVGCGSGSLVWWMQQRGYVNAAGIDVSAELVQVAGTLGVRNIEQADLRDYLGSRPAAYDLLILRDVLEHFDRGWILEVLELCRRSLKPGGVLAVQVPNAEAPLWGRIRYGDFTHEMAFTEGALRQLLAVTGYRDVAVHPAGPSLRGPRDLPRHVLWTCLQVFYRLLVFAETGRGDAVVTESIIAVATRAAAGVHSE